MISLNATDKFIYYLLLLCPITPSFFVLFQKTKYPDTQGTHNHGLKPVFVPIFGRSAIPAQTVWNLKKKVGTLG